MCYLSHTVAAPCPPRSPSSEVKYYVLAWSTEVGVKQGISKREGEPILPLVTTKYIYQSKAFQTSACV